MREETVSQFLDRAGAEWPTMAGLIEKGMIVK
jgi:hypothetical protein